jgi:hypothetical protein
MNMAEALPELRTANNVSRHFLLAFGFLGWDV